MTRSEEEDRDEKGAAGVKRATEEDSPITCEYCGKTLPSREMDEHLYEEHGMTA